MRCSVSAAGAKRCNADPGPIAIPSSVATRISFYAYILANRRNGTLYVGVTNNLSRRVSEHKEKLVPGFTRQYGVDKLVHAEEYLSILEARARENSIKRWRRAWKIALIEKSNPEWRDLSFDL
jgi:putative endonuclease